MATEERPAPRDQEAEPERVRDPIREIRLVLFLLKDFGHPSHRFGVSGTNQFNR